MKRLFAVMAACAAVSGCGESGTKKKKDPIPPPVVAPNPPPKNTGTPVKGTEFRNGTVDPVKPFSPPHPVKPPPPTDPAGSAVGNRALELALNDAEGGAFLLSALRTKNAVLVVFGQTICPNCKQGTPDLVKAAEKWESKGLVVAEVFLAEDVALVKEFATQFGLKHRVLPDPKQISRGKFKWNVGDMPHHILISKEGKVVSVGKLPSDETIEQALK